MKIFQISLMILLMFNINLSGADYYIFSLCNMSKILKEIEDILLEAPIGQELIAKFMAQFALVPPEKQVTVFPITYLFPREVLMR